MAKSFYILKKKSSQGHYDDDGTYCATEYEGPYELCYCETYGDAKEMLAKYSQTLKEYDWVELTYVNRADDKITKRYGEYDKRKQKFKDGYEVTLWIIEKEFTKP